MIFYLDGGDGWRVWYELQGDIGNCVVPAVVGNAVKWREDGGGREVQKMECDVDVVNRQGRLWGDKAGYWSHLEAVGQVHEYINELTQGTEWVYGECVLCKEEAECFVQHFVPHTPYSVSDRHR